MVERTSERHLAFSLGSLPLFEFRLPVISLLLSLTFFFLLPGLELHNALRALLVEDPVAALAAADDVPGLELVLMACVFAVFFFGVGARRSR